MKRNYIKKALLNLFSVLGMFVFCLLIPKYALLFILLGVIVNLILLFI